uniref:HMG box domain-containing protein n=1 Tax=Vannella robusta TaxID=1487602 RepID=A0A6U1WKC4_9EUKA|mmetsp:Transcript_4260/g.5257  ORF Transcript_4260/g.5257 Transcript_4260/m.5257 type:complete len:153 (+) Transcript_4260:65-523(+)
MTEKKVQLPRPKRSESNFLVFCQEQRQKADGTVPLKELAAKWETLDAKSKQIYDQKSALLLLKYQRDMADYFESLEETEPEISSPPEKKRKLNDQSSEDKQKSAKTNHQEEPEESSSGESDGIEDSEDATSSGEEEESEESEREEKLRIKRK